MSRNKNSFLYIADIGYPLSLVYSFNYKTKCTSFPKDVGQISEYEKSYDI